MPREPRKNRASGRSGTASLALLGWQEGAHRAAVLRGVARLDPDPTLTAEPAHETFTRQERRDPTVAALAHGVLERGVPRDEVTGVDHDVAVAVELLDAAES